MRTDNLLRLIEKKLRWKTLRRHPRFLSKYKWKPRFVLYERKDDIYIAVDVIFNQQFPQKLFKNEVKKAIRSNTKLRVCFFSSSEYGYGILKKFCKEHNIGLKIYTTDSINTIVPFPSEKVESVRKIKVKKEGWFPRVILDKARHVKRIKSSELIIDLVDNLEKYTTQDKQLSLICRFIDKMLASRQKYVGSSIPFMKLSNFENLLNFSNISCRDHTFHSARVFLIGCIIIDQFYDKFLEYYKDILGTNRISIEYMWLIASLFHDLGRIKQEAHRILLSDPTKENVHINEGIEEEMRKKWKERDYQISLCNIVELINQSCTSKKKRDIPFTGYALAVQIDPQFVHVFQENYNKRNSHGVIGCFELCADLLGKMRAAKYKNKTFLLYHVFPAVVAIALHDWKIWKDLAELKVFPISLRNFPLAALLIYIDTWDDYKREQKAEKITINDLTFTKNTVTVNLTWHKSDEYLEEKFKYTSFERNVIFSDLKLKIEISNKTTT